MGSYAQFGTTRMREPVSASLVSVKASEDVGIPPTRPAPAHRTVGCMQTTLTNAPSSLRLPAPAGVAAAGLLVAKTAIITVASSAARR